MKEKLRLYIKENYEKPIFEKTSAFKSYKESYDYDGCLSYADINTFIKQKDEYTDFQTMLFKLIDEKNLKDSDVYNKVHIDRRLFSKIRSDNNYHPSKETIIFF